MEFNRHNIALLLFLELISIAPLIIILGNVVPFWPLKIHHIGFGLIFLCSVWILAQDPYKKWVLYIGLFYCCIQFTFDHFYIKNIIDYFFGPFVLLTIIDLLVNKKVPEHLIKKYTKRFRLLLWVPITIAVLQYLKVLPLTFWDANYINTAYFEGGIKIPRPNGFLYHGSELAIIICFTSLFQYFEHETKSFWTLILLIFIAVITYYKAIVGCTILLTLSYLAFINKGPLSRYQIISKTKLIWIGSLALCFGTYFILQFVYQSYTYSGYLFPSGMLTGRGGIWNVYLDAIIKDYSLWNYLFGSGMGSWLDLFKEFATKEAYYPLRIEGKLTSIPHTHNAILSIFMNSGIVGIFFHLYLLKVMYSQVIRWQPNTKWNKTVFFAVFLIPCITIGITIILFETAIIWPCIGFLFCRWYEYTKKIDA